MRVQDDPRQEVADLLRELNLWVISRQPDQAMLGEVAGLLRYAVTRLGGLADDHLDYAEWGYDHVDGPIAGRFNAVAPPMDVRPRAQDGSVVALLTWGAAYEGPPGQAHGGVIAAAFDEVLGDAQPEPPGQTARLVVDYRSPAPLGVELVLRAHQVSTEGRKRTMAATLHDGERLVAEAQALFITARPQ
jgi:acyl-coenzyme A thioesterase PaaI-like protein